jgi:hypothetical protein
MSDKTIFERNRGTIGYALGSCFAEVITTPIYTIKTLYQTSETQKSIKNTIQYIYSNKKIWGFYNAFWSTIFARLISSFCKYLMYNEIKYYRKTPENDLANNMINGCIAGIFLSFLVHPIDVLTNQLQRQLSLNRSFLHINVMYSGFSQTIIRNFFLYSVLFSVFDYAKYLTNNNIILSAFITSSISTTMLQPIDYLRTRLMAQQKQEIGYILKNFRRCWKGYHLNYIANTTHFTITMFVSYEFTKRVAFGE